MTKRTAIALAGLLLLTVPASAQRLARTVIPHHYDLALTPDFETDTFSGVERIEVGIQEPTKVIELHALEIEIDAAAVVSGSGKQVSGDARQVATVELDPQRETARLSVAEVLPPGPATIEITYRGILNEELVGFYLGVDADGRKYAASQMEATDARRAFPSFDEPSMKASFAITLIVDEEHTAFSNGAEVSNTAGPAPGKRVIRFATTPRMSTYLVALVVGHFDCLEDDYEGHPIRVCARPEKVHLGRFALAANRAVLDYFEDYFDYPYPFGKLDHIALPDYAEGAMENTGAIVYRETALLLDPEKAPTSQQRWVAGVVAHEVAHMWFGDLVTMEWWDDIWLNEGFATFMASKAVEHWKPEWNFGVANAADSGWPMDTDVLKATRKIRQQASTPEEIEALFDGVAYYKTAAVLRMVESYIGADAMGRGIADYMKRHAYGNTTAEDFYDALSAAAGRDVAALMRGYVDQPGLPLVSVESVCDGDETVVTLSQQRFFADRSRLGSAPEQLWNIPVCFADNDCVLLAKRSRQARLAGCREGLFANWRGRGYYLTAHRAGLAATIGSRSAEERLVLLRDQWFLVRVGELSIASFLDLVTAIAPTERQRRVVDEYLGPLAKIEEHLVAEADRAAMRAWLAKTLLPLAAELGWHPAAGEGPTEMELRSSVYRVLGLRAADPSTRRQARALAEAYLVDRSAVHPTMASTVLYVAAREGDEKLYEGYQAAYKAAVDPGESARFRHALGRFDGEALRGRNFELVLSDEIRGQDKLDFWGSMLADASRWAAVWELATRNWEAVLASIPEQFHPHLVPGLGRQICDEERRALFEAFAAKVDTAHEPRSLAQARERIATCIDMKALHQERLSAYLRPPSGGLARD